MSTPWRFRLSSTTARRRLQYIVDVLAWWGALLCALLIRYDVSVPWWRSSLALAICAGAAAIGQAGFGRVTFLYRGRYRFGSFDEVAGVAVTGGLTSALVFALNVASTPIGQRLPATVPLAAGPLAVLLQVTVRYIWRAELDRRVRREDEGEPIIVFGAGEGAWQIVRSMYFDSPRRYRPVAMLDDDPDKQNLRFYGVSVRGTRADIAHVAEATGAEILLIAIPSATGSLIRELAAEAEARGLQVKVVPVVGELVDGVGVGDIRDLDLADLLGRRQVETDLDAIAGYLTGRRVLVTGAGGSIGSELCRQLYRYKPSELMMLDRDESALHAVQLSIHGRALLDSPDLILADIRDSDLLNRIFEERRPEVVFHAAALKHLPLLERFPGESIKTNIWGTLTVLKAAQLAGVRHFVNISTDKAARPCSALGYSKRVTERLTAQVAREINGNYLSVRFGNVLGSRGSVLTAFTAQAATGGPITVTDPDVTRYFMTVQEAVQLVIQAAAIGRSGEALVLDMGDPVRIANVAHQIAAQARRHVEVVYTGLRPGEKLHEDLFGDGEADVRREHPLISHVDVEPLAEVAALGLDPWAPTGEVHRALRQLAEAVADDDLLDLDTAGRGDGRTSARKVSGAG